MWRRVRWRSVPQRALEQIRRLLHAALGRETPLLTDDRRVLEDVVFAHFRERPDCRRVLFVGCDWYTRHYERFFPNQEYWTLERSPRRRKHGAAHHVTDTLERLAEHFPPGHFDLIICNGVVGWGLDRRQDAEVAFDACHTVLRAGGVLVIGWNDIPEKRPFPLEELHSLARFEPFVLPPLGASRHLTRTRDRHSFLFLTRPAA